MNTTFVRLLLISTAAMAQQQQDANLYAYFNWTGGPFGQNLDQRISVVQKAKATYWAMIWDMDHAPSGNSGGYMGLQTDGTRFDGSKGDTAIFSIWGARKSEGAGCGKFGGEGTGMSCRAAFPIIAGRWYRLRTWKLREEAQGVWWGGWVLDETTGVETHLGNLLAGRGQSTLSGHANFSEYYGSPVASPQMVPKSIVLWSTPSADETAPGKYRFTSTFEKGTKAKGTTGSVTNAGRIDTGHGTVMAVRIVQGG